MPKRSAPAGTPVERLRDALDAHDCAPHGPVGKITARCPSHDDRQASLSVGTGDDGRALAHCHAGCEVVDILDALGLEWSDLHVDAPKPFTNAGIRSTGAMLERDGRMRVGSGLYQPGAVNGSKMRVDAGARRDLWPDPATVLGATLLIVEGEPDAVTAASLGLAAVSYPGTGGWKPEYAAPIAAGRKRVIVVADCDAPGRRVAKLAAADIAEHCSNVRVLDLEPGLMDGHDLSDWARDARDDAGRADAKKILLGMAADAPRVTPVARADNEASPVAAIRRALFDDAQDTRDDAGPAAHEEVPGTGGLLHRSTVSCFFADQGAGKSILAKTLGASAAASGERVAYFDRENGAALTRDHMRAILAAHGEWPDVLAEERWVGRHWPELSPSWSPADYAEAVAGAGFTVVVYDSLREFFAQLGLDPDRETNVTSLLALLVTPLLRRGVAVLMLDNVGHAERGRPKGSRSKLDAIPQGYLVETTSRFTPTDVGQIKITCTRSRYGDIGREWTVRVGGGAFDVPTARSGGADEQRAQDERVEVEQVERYRLACLAALDDAPLGRDTLIGEIRKRGAKGSNVLLRERLTDLVEDPASGIVKTPAGYVLTPGRPGPGQGTATPGHPPQDPRPPWPFWTSPPKEGGATGPGVALATPGPALSETAAT